MKYEIKSVITDSFEMEYMKFGSGNRTMVIIPGISFFSALLSAPSIAEAYSAFAENFTVFLFDRKKRIERGYSIEEMAEDTVTAMKEAGIKKACIFGSSMGGMIAQSIAVYHPEIVEKLFIASSMSKANDTFIRNVGITEELIKSGKTEDMVRLFLKLVYSDEYLEKYKSGFEFIVRTSHDIDVERFLVLTDACCKFDISPRASEISCPAMAVGSRKDKMLTGEATVETAKLIGCSYYLYDGYGHAVYDEAPDYKERILDFFGNYAD